MSTVDELDKLSIQQFRVQQSESQISEIRYLSQDWTSIQLGRPKPVKMPIVRTKFLTMNIPTVIVLVVKASVLRTKVQNII